LKIKYQNLLKNNEQIQLNNKNIINNIKINSENEINELKNKINILEENKIIYENNLKEINSFQNLIKKLKQENSSLNNIIIDLNSKIENKENNIKNINKKVKNFEDKLKAKEFIINDYIIKYEQILKENIMNKNRIKELEENNKTLLNNFDIIKTELNKYETEAMNKKEKKEEDIEFLKEEYNKDIEKYKDIIKQKDIKINELNNKISNDKINLEKILILQKEISELKVENNQLYLNNKKLENKEKENKKESIVYLIQKDLNKEKIKDAYRILIKENEQLKNNIIKLKEYHH
jgi:chromosome segregation protein